MKKGGGGNGFAFSPIFQGTRVSHSLCDVGLQNLPRTETGNHFNHRRRPLSLFPSPPFLIALFPQEEKEGEGRILEP